MQLGLVTRRTSSATSPSLTPAATSGTARVAAVGVGLVDHPITEGQEPRHASARAVLVVERDERQLAAGRVDRVEVVRRLDLEAAAVDLELLVAAGVEGELRARPGARDEVEQLAADEAGGAEDADPHCARQCNTGRPPARARGERPAEAGADGRRTV